MHAGGVVYGAEGGDTHREEEVEVHAGGVVYGAEGGDTHREEEVEVHAGGVVYGSEGGHEGGRALPVLQHRRP